MAQSRSSLASYALEEAHIPLPASQAPPTPSEAQEPASDFPSVSLRTKPQMVNYPCRLRPDQVDALNHLKATLRVLPADLIRDFVDMGLRRINKEGLPR